MTVLETNISNDKGTFIQNDSQVTIDFDTLPSD